jgi:hypothetical protein
MKANTLKMFGLACGLGLTVIFTSCSSDVPEGKKLSYTHGRPGGITVETYTTNATVTAIDPATRRLTLVSPKGDQSAYTAAPEVSNFDQIRVGDQVKVTAAAELVVFLRQNGEPAANGEAALVPLAPKGAKAGGIMAHTVEVTAKVTHLDYNNQRATLLFPDGTSRTIDVRKDVNLYQQTIGADVVIRTTEPLAIRIEKP